MFMFMSIPGYCLGLTHGVQLFCATHVAQWSLGGWGGNLCRPQLQKMLESSMFARSTARFSFSLVKCAVPYVSFWSLEWRPVLVPRGLSCALDILRQVFEKLQTLNWRVLCTGAFARSIVNCMSKLCVKIHWQLAHIKLAFVNEPILLRAVPGLFDHDGLDGEISIGGGQLMSCPQLARSLGAEPSGPKKPAQKN